MILNHDLMRRRGMPWKVNFKQIESESSLESGIPIRWLIGVSCAQHKPVVAIKSKAFLCIEMLENQLTGIMLKKNGVCHLACRSHSSSMSPGL